MLNKELLLMGGGEENYIEFLEDGLYMKIIVHLSGNPDIMAGVFWYVAKTYSDTAASSLISRYPRYVLGDCALLKEDKKYTFKDPKYPGATDREVSLYINPDDTPFSCGSTTRIDMDKYNQNARWYILTGRKFPLISVV